MPKGSTAATWVKRLRSYKSRHRCECTLDDAAWSAFRCADSDDFGQSFRAEVRANSLMRISRLDKLRDEFLDLAIALGEVSFEIGESAIGAAVLISRTQNIINDRF